MGGVVLQEVTRLFVRLEASISVLASSDVRRARSSGAPGGVTAAGVMMSPTPFVSSAPAVRLQNRPKSKAPRGQRETGCWAVDRAGLTA